MATPRTFPPEVFARLAPDIYFERHIAAGQRPNGRKFDERRPITVIPDPDAMDTSDENPADLAASTASGAALGSVGDAGAAAPALRGALGSAVVRAGSATVVCGVTGGVTRFVGEGGVYANVEVPRGGAGGANSKPTTEEQVATIRAHRMLLAADLPRANFKLSPDHDIELVLSARVIVLSRTGPVMDLVWAAIVAALRNTRIPPFFPDERNPDELVPDLEAPRRELVLPMNLADLHVTLGLVKADQNKDLVLSDIDGAVEEECIANRISYARSQNGVLTNFSLTAPGGCSVASIQEALRRH